MSASPVDRDRDSNDDVRAAVRIAMQGVTRLKAAAKRVVESGAAPGRPDACHGVGDVVDNAVAAGRALLLSRRPDAAALRAWGERARSLRALLLDAARGAAAGDGSVLLAACAGGPPGGSAHETRGVRLRVCLAGGTSRCAATVEAAGADPARVDAVAVQLGLRAAELEPAADYDEARARSKAATRLGATAGSPAPMPDVYEAGGLALAGGDAGDVLALAHALPQNGGHWPGGVAPHATVLCKARGGVPSSGKKRPPAALAPPTPARKRLRMA